ncbi:MAG TPA: VOC family protein [Candidatus Dormibacteraeota bacterium]|nr:VOC family protein [Candidatus Dormibacteraeota bacterium]
MSESLISGPPHHIRLSVTDVERSREFYCGVLGFEVAMDAPPPPEDPYHRLTMENLQGGIVLINAGVLIGLRPVDAARSGDRFDPFRVGLDHLSFGVPARADLDRALSRFTDTGTDHGEITELPMFGIAVLPFRDPDGIQLELTSPL